MAPKISITYVTSPLWSNNKYQNNIIDVVNFILSKNHVLI